MVPKHPNPLSGGDRKALDKERIRSRAMVIVLDARAKEKRGAGEALIREAGNLFRQSWNKRERRRTIAPSPTID